MTQCNESDYQPGGGAPVNDLRERDAVPFSDSLLLFADWLERDRREPDKILCHVASLRRFAQDAAALPGTEKP